MNKLLRHRVAGLLKRVVAQADLVKMLQARVRSDVNEAVTKNWDPAAGELRRSIEDLEGRLLKIGSRPALAGRAIHRAPGAEAGSVDELVKAARDAINTMS